MSQAERDKWNAKYRDRGAATTEPSRFLVSLDGVLPRAGRALDVGGGSGRHAIWLARRGLDVTIADVSAEGLRIAAASAAAAGVSVATVEVDLDEPAAFPAGPWDLVVDFHYLNRTLFAAFERELAPGGLLAFCQPTVRNLQRHPRPGAAYLLEEGEAAGLVPGLEIVSLEEGWSDEDRHEARLLARRP